MACAVGCTAAAAGISSTAVGNSIAFGLGALGIKSKKTKRFAKNITSKTKKLQRSITQKFKKLTKSRKKTSRKKTSRKKIMNPRIKKINGIVHIPKDF